MAAAWFDFLAAAVTGAHAIGFNSAFLDEMLVPSVGRGPIHRRGGQRAHRAWKRRRAAGWSK